MIETLALLQSRVGLDAARQFERYFLPLLTVVWVGEDLHRRAFQRLDTRAQRDLSLVDCTSFVVMEEVGIQAAFGYDEHFSREGFSLIGRPHELVNLI